MTNAGGYENANVLFGQVFMEFAAVNQDIHGVSHAETVPKVMKRVVSVVFLHTELEPKFINGFTFLAIAMKSYETVVSPNPLTAGSTFLPEIFSVLLDGC